MDTRSQQKYVDSLINTAIAQKVANRNESTREGPYDSLLEVNKNEASIATYQPQPNKSRRQEYLNSIAEAAVAKTIADEKENKKSTV